jgi:hypothetical protein
MGKLIIGDPATGGFSGGVRYDISNNDLKPNESPMMWNYLISDSGLRKRTGSLSDHEVSLCDDSSDYPITGLYRFFDGTNFKTFAKCGPTVYDVKAAGAHTEIATGLNMDDEIQFASWFGRYFFVDGNDLWSGTDGVATKVTFLDEDGTALGGELPKGKSILLHNQRLWLTYNAARRTYVYFSETDYYDRWRSLGWVACDRDDGKKITGFIEDRDKVVSFKRNQMYFILGDYTLGNLAVVPGPAVGAYDQKTILRCPDGFVRFYGPNGVWQYADSTGAVNISQGKVDAELKRIPQARREQVCAGFFDRYYILFYPSGDGANDRALAYDIYLNCWIPLRGWNVTCCYNFEDETLHAGWATGGKIKQLFTDASHDDGEEIEASWTSKYFGQPGVVNALDRIRVNVRTGQSLTISYNSDPGERTANTVSFYVPDIGTYLGNDNRPELGGFQLGDDEIPGDGDVLVSDEELGIGHEEYNDRLQGGETFREIQFTLYEKSTNPQEIDFVECDYFSVREW